MHTVIAYISPVWDIIGAVRRRWLQQPGFDSLEWHWQCVLTHRLRADGHGQTDRATEGERKKKKGRERKQPRVNSALWTATIRHLSRQHLFAFISRRWITYSWQSQSWISTLVRNVTVIGMLSQVPHSMLVPYFSFFDYFSLPLSVFPLTSLTIPLCCEWITHLYWFIFELCLYPTRSALVLFVVFIECRFPVWVWKKLAFFRLLKTYPTLQWKHHDCNVPDLLYTAQSVAFDKVAVDTFLPV